nr:MAG: hypothetical protein 1 [Leviviridae sp.]
MPFQVDHDYLVGGRINNVIPTDGGDFVMFKDYYADAFTFAGRPQFPLITSYPEEKSSAAYAAAALARTNPNRPNVDVVANVLELGDLPMLVKSAGSTLAQQLAGNYLRYHFGIKPIVNDIAKLINFTKLMNKKLDAIEKLRKTGGLRKTVTLDKLSASQLNSNIVLQSAGSVYFTDTFETIGHRTIRGHVRWLPGADYSKYSQAEMSAMAKKAVIGLEANFSGLWEGLPWSWLIDWYSNVGDLLMQTRNLIPVTCDSITIMRETTSVSVTHPNQGGNQRIESATVTKVRKERYPASATLDAHLPLLEAGQMGILTSLLVMGQKYRPPR